MRLPSLMLPFAVLTLLAAAPAPQDAAPPKAAAKPGAKPAAPAASGAVVPLADRRGTPIDATARQLVAQDIAESARAGETPLLLTGTATLGSASDRPVVFVQLQSARECGSAGCSTSAFLWQKGAWKRVLDGVGGKVAVLPSRTRGMADLASDNVRYVWTGQDYRDPRPAPAVDLRPRAR